MLRKRLITILTFNDGVLFRTKLFEPDYRYTLNFVDAWSVDEIVILDVTRPDQGDKRNFFDVVRRFAETCFVPLTVGGGIRDLDDVKKFLDLGADKVVLNTGAVRRPEFIGEVARAYGSQCVVLSIDARRDGAGGYEVCSEYGSSPTGLTPEQWAERIEAEGAGEILVTAIERDGSLQGYDIDLCRRITEAVRIPVLISGGAGNWRHFIDGFKTGGASAVCTTNIYHFTETSIRSAKKALADADIPVRP